MIRIILDCEIVIMVEGVRKRTKQSAHYITITILIILLFNSQSDISSERSKFVSLQEFVDPIPPVDVNSPDDRSYLVHTIGNRIVWQPSYDGLWVFASYFYSVFRNGTEVQGGIWHANDDPISVNIDGLLPGVYNFTIFISNGVSDKDSVFVTVTGPVGWPIVLAAILTPIVIIFVIYYSILKK